MSKPSVSLFEQTLPFPLAHACTLAGLLQTLMDSSPIAVVALDATHRFSTGNSAFHAMFGYPAEALLHADFDEAITTAETRDEARRLSTSVLQGQRIHATTKRRRSDGEVIAVEISGIPMIEDGKLAGIYGLYRQAPDVGTASGKNPDQTQRPLPGLASGITVPVASNAARLTEREQHLLRLLAAGRKSKGIAQELGISVRTVESHRASINQKCGFRSIADLVRFAMLHQSDDAAST